MERPDHGSEANRIISEALDSYAPVVDRSALEENAWEGLMESVKEGWMDYDAAERMYRKWFYGESEEC